MSVATPSSKYFPSFSSTRPSTYSTSSNGSGIFNHEICLCLLNQLEERATSWIEGLFATASANQNNEKPTKEQVTKIFCDGLELVAQWTPEILRRESDALTQNCPNIREIYRTTVEIYVASYFQLYPNLEYEINVPSMSVFVHSYYRFLARDKSIRSLTIFQMFGDHRRSVFEGAIRNALYHVLKKPMQEIFASLENMQRQNSKTPRHSQVQQQQLAQGPPMVMGNVPSLPTHPNHLFQQVVQNYVQDVATPANKTAEQAPESVKSVKSTKTPSSRSSNSSRRQDSNSNNDNSSRRSARSRRSDNAIPASVPVLPSQGSARSSRDSHRTIELPTDAPKSRERDRGHRSRRDSYSSDSDSGHDTDSFSASDNDKSEDSPRSTSSRRSARSSRSSRDRRDRDHRSSRDRRDRDRSSRR